mgnify:CR=1 FL=1
MSIKSRRDTSRKLRRLRSQYKFFITSLNGIRSDLKLYEKEWAKDISLFIGNGESDVKDSKETLDTKSFNAASVYVGDEEKVRENTPELKKSHPEWAKSLYKKIAKKTHPDKIKEKKDFEKLSSLFHKAVDKMDKKDYESLFDIAFELGIDTNLPDEIIIEKMEKSISNIREEIEKIEKSIPWVWGESFGMPDIRYQIIKSFTESRKIEIEDKKIRRIISEIETSS